MNVSSLVATAVTTDQLHPSTGQREVEDPRVRRVHEIEAYDLSHRRFARELCLAVDQHHVPEPPHRGVVGPHTVEWRDLAILDEQIVQRDAELSVDGWPVRRVGRLDDDRPVQAHLQAEVLADVRVVPVEPGIGELHLVRERPADRDR